MSQRRQGRRRRCLVRHHNSTIIAQKHNGNPTGTVAFIRFGRKIHKPPGRPQLFISPSFHHHHYHHHLHRDPWPSSTPNTTISFVIALQVRASSTISNLSSSHIHSLAFKPTSMTLNSRRLIASKPSDSTQTRTRRPMRKRNSRTSGLTLRATLMYATELTSRFYFRSKAYQVLSDPVSQHIGRIYSPNCTISPTPFVSHRISELHTTSMERTK